MEFVFLSIRGGICIFVIATYVHSMHVYISRCWLTILILVGLCDPYVFWGKVSRFQFDLIISAYLLNSEVSWLKMTTKENHQEILNLVRLFWGIT